MKEVKTSGSEKNKVDKVDFQKKINLVKSFTIDDDYRPNRPKHHPYMENSKLGRMLIAMNYM